MDHVEISYRLRRLGQTQADIARNLGVRLAWSATLFTGGSHHSLLPAILPR